MSECSSDHLELDEYVLDALMHALTEDRRVPVATCLPQILNELTHGESEPGPRRHENRRWRWEHARANTVAEVLGRAVNEPAGEKEWSTAEEEWKAFLQVFGSGRRHHTETRDAQKTILGAAMQALSPVLGFLLCETNISEDKLLCVRRFYARAVSSLLRVFLVGITEEERLVWLRRHAWCTEFAELLHPFLQSEVEPLAKELVFHFQVGKKTARREEPQHFFSFLLQMYDRYNADTRTHGWIPLEKTGKDSISLRTLGSVSLASTAVFVFRSVYGWHEGSKFLTTRDFTVHGVNCFIDFLDKVKGNLHVGAQLLLAENILFTSAFRIFLETARVTAERSLRTGASVLWRQKFLLMESSQGFNVICGTQHMIRCLEALIRRLAVVLSLLPSYTVTLWERTLSPSLSTFASTLEEAKESCDSIIERIMVSLELFTCVQTMHSAAEEWLEQCCEACSGVEIALPSLERLALWRDELTRNTTYDVKNFLTRLFAAPNFTEQDLQACDAILRTVCKGKTTAHRILYEDMKLSLTQLTTEEQQSDLREYCELGGMTALATFLRHTVV